MGLYTNWTDYVVNYVKENGEAAFWAEYSAVEKSIYTKILANHTAEIKGSVKELAAQYETSSIFFMGFLDGINESLETALELESIEEDSNLDLKINFEQLYFNMLDAKADYLYQLPQWEAIFSAEKRKEIQRQWRDSKTIINENKIGRNDPCTCGSGKKYKKCCGK